MSENGQMVKILPPESLSPSEKSPQQIFKSLYLFMLFGKLCFLWLSSLTCGLNSLKLGVCSCLGIIVNLLTSFPLSCFLVIFVTHNLPSLNIPARVS